LWHSSRGADPGPADCSDCECSVCEQAAAVWLVGAGRRQPQQPGHAVCTMCMHIHAYGDVARPRGLSVSFKGPPPPGQHCPGQPNGCFQTRMWQALPYSEQRLSAPSWCNRFLGGGLPRATWGLADAQQCSSASGRSSGVYREYGCNIMMAAPAYAAPGMLCRLCNTHSLMRCLN
jgi:hypothetical protein